MNIRILPLKNFDKTPKIPYVTISKKTGVFYLSKAAKVLLEITISDTIGLAYDFHSNRYFIFKSLNGEGYPIRAHKTGSKDRLCFGCTYYAKEIFKQYGLGPVSQNGGHRLYLDTNSVDVEGITAYKIKQTAKEEAAV